MLAIHPVDARDDLERSGRVLISAAPLVEVVHCVPTLYAPSYVVAVDGAPLLHRYLTLSLALADALAYAQGRDPWEVLSL